SVVLLFGVGASSCRSGSDAETGRLGEAQQDVGEAATYNIVSADGIGTTNQIGRVTESGSGQFRTFHAYDALGRDTKIQLVTDGWSYVYSTTYGYPNGSVSGLGTVIASSTFPDSEVVRYTYDAGGAPQGITTTPRWSSTQTIVSQVVRNARGQTVSVTYGNGV